MFPSASQTRDSSQLRWSKSERAIAREAFDHALNHELQEGIQQAKQMASQIKQSSELWELESHLTQRRKEINCKYEYRTSKLTFVFGTLLHEGRVTEEELLGLRGDKLEAIRSYADLLSKRGMSPFERYRLLTIVSSRVAPAFT